jgi:hypothetical protein
MSTVVIGGIGPLILTGTNPALETDGPIRTSHEPAVDDDVITLSSLNDTLADFVKRDGTTPLTADWDVGSAGNLVCDRVNARNSDGLVLLDDSGNYGLHIRDGGNVSIGKLGGSGYKFRVNNAGVGLNTYFGMYGYHPQVTGPEMHMVHSRGVTMDSFAATLNDDDLGRLKFYGVNSALDSFVTGAEISVTQKGGAGATYNAANMVLETYSNVGKNASQLVLKNDSKVGIGKVPTDNKLEVDGDIQVPFSSSIRVGGITGTGNDGLRMSAAADYGYIDLKGGGRILIRVDDVDGGTEVLGISNTEVSVKNKFEVWGDSTLGNESIDLITCIGRLLLRNPAFDPLVTPTAGTRGELIVYDDRLMLKITGTGTDNNWLELSPYAHNHDSYYSPITHDHDSDYAALTHDHDSDYAALTHNHDSSYLKIDGSTELSADWNIGTKWLGIGDDPNAPLDVAEVGALEVYFRTYVNSTFGNALKFLKSRGTTLGSNDTTLDDDVIAEMDFYGITGLGSQYCCGKIVVQQNGNATNSYVPADVMLMGAGSSGLITNQLVLSANGKVGINQAPSGSYNLDVNGSGKFSTTLGVDGKLTVNSNVDLGVDEDDAINIYGSLVIRDLGAVPTSSSTYGRRGEVGRYNDHLYLKTIDTGTNTNWILII